MPTKRRRRRLTTAVLVVMVGLIATGVYYVVKPKVPAILGQTGCTAGSGKAAVALDPTQAQIAATIAAVAHRQGMPARAVTVAYATAMQESKLHNPGYGDLDSVGVFQQRPSQGWGPASKLVDPVYATIKFFQALARVPHYQRLPVYRAAQAVQHSADGSAYIQYETMAAALTPAFTGARPRGVWCWPPGQHTGTARYTAARRALLKAFGSLPARAAALRRNDPSLLVRAPHAPVGWTVAAWLVTHAGQYKLSQVAYDGFRWRASTGGAWTEDKSAPAGAVLAS